MKIRNMARCALLTALMTVCAWLTVPAGEIAFTMQTFALFLTLGILGGKGGSLVCLVYLLLGAAGFPCFSGFRGGMGVLLGPTGGYIWGFLVTALVYWAATALFGDSAALRFGAMLLGLFACYSCGTLWYLYGYGLSGSAVGIVIAKCVLPYLLPDLGKLAAALALIRRLRPYI